MKNLYNKSFSLLLFLIIFSVNIYAQDKSNNNKPQRCSTMEYLENQIKADPTLPAKWKAQGELIQQQNATAKQNNTLKLQAITIIPVVFHVVLGDNEQAIVIDALVQREIDILNRDFAGLNPDSTKLPAAFKAVFGHSEIRFCLAKRTPNNLTTNGIERRVTDAAFTQNTLSDLKKFSGGGLDTWDANKYLNIWVANFSDNLLGIATLPFSTPANEQGVCIDWGTMDLACASPFSGVYDAGRTLVHEVGHYFYLWHIWGDEDGCSGNDFRIQEGFPLSGSCSNDDTPNQSHSTNTCLSGVQLDACSPVAPGFMYQNYMDYSNDACYGMFTLGQVCRMQSCLDNYRATLKSSNGCVPVVAVNNDIRVSEILNPTSRGFTCGTKTIFCDNHLKPQVLIVNDGDAPLTSFTFTIRIDGNVVTQQNWTGNLSPAGFAYIDVDAFLAPTGLHTLRISTSNPNGGNDGRPGNDFAEAAFSVTLPAVEPPVIQSFESPIFPPDNWQILNPDENITWVRTTLAANPGIASARLNAFSYSSLQQKDFLITPKIKITGVDVLSIKFNVAYAKFSNDPEDWEALEVVYSEDCGITWKPTGYKKNGNELATNGGGVTGGLSFIPTPAQWRNETINMNLCGTSSSEIIIAFKSTNNFGNNIYLDDVKIEKQDGFLNNSGLVNLQSPQNLICDENGNIIPKFTLINKGVSPLTTVSLNVSIDGANPIVQNWNGNLLKCASEIVDLAAVPISVGNHTIKIYSTKPNGVDDPDTNDDTLKTTFSIVNRINAPLVEGFENNTFPPANFIVVNPDNTLTWERTNTASQAGTASMVIKSFNYLSNNTIDKFITPLINVTNADSSFISFDYAYARGSSNPHSTILPLDTLEISVSKDCGLNSIVVLKKWGEELITTEEGLANVEFIPNASQWKNIRISITNLVDITDQFQVFFTLKGNNQNNLYIDNINIFTKELPQKLKEQGYLIYPNPFKNAFRIHHYSPPVNLQYVQVFNTIGQLLLNRKYNGNATSVIDVDLGKLPKGVYLLKMIYTNKEITERIVKDE